MLKLLILVAGLASRAHAWLGGMAEKEELIHSTVLRQP
jgi:hypothetical protein